MKIFKTILAFKIASCVILTENFVSSQARLGPCRGKGNIFHFGGGMWLGWGDMVQNLN